jgi:hypothetical protein
MPRKSPGDPRSAVLNVRVPEKTKYGLKLASRLFHEPLPDILIRALDAYLASEKRLMVETHGHQPTTNLLEVVWGDTDSERLAKLAFRFPSLLSRAEQELWDRVGQAAKYWSDGDAAGKKRGSSMHGHRDEKHFLWDTFEADWEQLSKTLPA